MILQYQLALSLIKGEVKDEIEALTARISSMEARKDELATMAPDDVEKLTTEAREALSKEWVELQDKLGTLSFVLRMLNKKLNVISNITVADIKSYCGAEHGRLPVTAQWTKPKLMTYFRKEITAFRNKSLPKLKKDKRWDLVEVGEKKAYTKDALNKCQYILRKMPNLNQELVDVLRESAI